MRVLQSLVWGRTRSEYTKMPGNGFLLVCASLLVVAFLYSAVGHAGASGYIAVLTLFGFAPAVIRPVALVLNILVAVIGTIQFARAGHFSWKLFWPFAVLAVPLAFVGGYVTLPTHWLKVLIGIVLLFSAARFLMTPGPEPEVHAPSKGMAIAVGGGLGLLAGLTGTGGGIFLTPILIFMKWSKTKQASAVSAMFILLNSVAGLAGFSASAGTLRLLPANVVWFPVVAVAGGGVGSYLGSRRLDPVIIKRLLAVVLTIAGLKLVLT
jgi:uncharacterized membrane protein YfcA